MLVFAIILLILLCIALLRFGVIFQYNDDGVALWLKAGFLKFSISTDDKVKKPKRKIKLGDMKPGSFDEFKSILKIASNTLNRFRRRLLIKKLVLHFTSAGDDPAAVALGFGAAHAVYGVVIPILERNFRIGHRDLRADADFDAKKPGIYAMLHVSVAVWELIYTGGALLPILTTIDFTKKSAKKSRSDDERIGKDNGERTDKQPA